MHRKFIPMALLLALSVPMTTALAQEDMPKPETQDVSEAVTDAWITTKVKADLLATDGVSGTDIDVDTKDGVVTLAGSVKSQEEADKALSVARDIKGVKKVESRLTVGEEDEEK